MPVSAEQRDGVLMQSKAEARLALWAQPLAPLTAFFLLVAVSFAWRMEVLTWVSIGLTAGYSLSGST